MDDITIARALHILALVHWIGGVSLVTAVILPAVAHFAEPSRRLAIFEEIEGRFSLQAKFSVTLAGLSGFYMTYQMDAWDRFLNPQYWWMHAMVAVWIVFTFVLFIGEPLFLHAWLRRYAARDADQAFTVMRRAHWMLLSISVLTIIGAVLGAHGILF